MSQAGIVDIEGSHPQIPTVFVANVGEAIPIANTIEILGSVVEAHSIPLETIGSGNTITVEVQYASASASSVGINAGVASFNSLDFSVDSNGFVALAGSAAVESFEVDAFTAPGTNPVIPNNSGLLIITGGQVAAGTTTNVIRTDSLAANTYTIQVQRSQAVALSAVGDNGVSHFNSTYFTVDINGFVSLAGSIPLTFDGNSGSAVPSSNVILISGGTTGLTTIGSGHTIALTGTLLGANGGTGVANTGLTITLSGGSLGKLLTSDSSGNATWVSPATSGTVTTVSVVSANGFSGTVANASSTPAITISTSITGVLSGNGTAMSGSVITQHALLIGGASNAITSSSVGATGTLLTGNTGADPTFGINYSTTPTASTISEWDANKNLSANNHINGYRTTATAGTTTTLVVGDAQQQYFTGSSTQTVLMPVTSTLVAGQTYKIVNLSSGTVTVQSSGANTIQAMGQNTTLLLTVINTGVTTAAGWDTIYTAEAVGITTIAGSSGSASGTTVTLSPGTTGLTYTGSGSTVTTAGTLVPSNGGTGAATLTGVLTGNGTSAVTASAVTQYDVLVGGASNAVSSVGPGSAGQVFQSAGNASNPAYSTATYPSVATGTGTILRADGTNWVATTATYPATTTAYQLLVSTAANVVGGITAGATGTLLAGNTGAVPSFQTFAALGLFNSINVQYFTATGTNTYTPTTNCVFAIVECVGAGGGGGGTNTTSTTTASVAGSGGAGGYSRKLITAPTSVTVTVGAGGTAGTAGGGSGGGGGATSYSSTFSASGGTGGGSSSAASTYVNANSGAGGTGSSGDLNITGQNGATSVAILIATLGFTGMIGSGGIPAFYGVGAPSVAILLNNNAVGLASTGYGGGGGGAVSITTNAVGNAGSVGGNGICIITEFIS